VNNSGHAKLVVRRPVRGTAGMEDLGTAALILVGGLALISLTGVVLIVKAVRG
jgi:hypothetical protein